MYIFLLERDEANVAHDQNKGFVVRAADARAARQLVASAVEGWQNKGDEDPQVWRDPTLSRCTRVGQATRQFDTPAILLRSFHAG